MRTETYKGISTKCELVDEAGGWFWWSRKIGSSFFFQKCSVHHGYIRVAMVFLYFMVYFCGYKMIKESNSVRSNLD